MNFEGFSEFPFQYWGASSIFSWREIFYISPWKNFPQIQKE